MLSQGLARQSLQKSFQRPPVTTRIRLSAITQQSKRVASTAAAVNSEPVSINEGYDILVKQRLNRPVSPHIAIYRPQITWYASGFNRITGSVLSGAFYIFGFGYLIQPLLSVHIFESSSIIAAFAGMALWAKIPIKFVSAFFFTFHSFNGLRHLSWDTGSMIKNPQVIRTGWLVIGISTVLSAWLAVM